MPVFVDPDPLEEGREELALDGTGGRRKERVGACHRMEAVQYHLGALLEWFDCRFEAGADFVLLDLEVSQSFAELVGCERTIDGEADQVFFLDVELPELLLPAGARLRLAGEGMLERGRCFLFCCVDRLLDRCKSFTVVGMRAGEHDRPQKAIALLRCRRLDTAQLLVLEDDENEAGTIIQQLSDVVSYRAETSDATGDWFLSAAAK